jgi:hypothetical protein
MHRKHHSFATFEYSALLILRFHGLVCVQLESQTYASLSSIVNQGICIVLVLDRIISKALVGLSPVAAKIQYQQIFI